jgi:hypothetical protein
VLDGPIVDPANGHEFYLLNTETWTASESEAQSLGGNLATITNEAENAWVYSTFGAEAESLNGDLWIGLYDPTPNDGSNHAADFVWVSGSTASYRNWNAAEPDNEAKYGGEYYGDMTGFSHNGQVPDEWNDKNNAGSNKQAFGVVEVAVPEPVTLSGVMVAGAALLSRRRRRLA